MEDTHVDEGERFGDLTVLGPADREGIEASVVCACDCGRFSEITVRMLLEERRTSCRACHATRRDRERNALARFREARGW